MARKVNRLSALKVTRAKDPGYYADGAGLWLQVSKSGSKSWIFRYMLNGRAREMGLGSVNKVSLADARHKATDARRMVASKIDPIDDRKQKTDAQRIERSREKTFDQCAKEYIKSHRASWTSAKHAGDWASTIAIHVSPVFGALPVSAIDTSLIIRVLEPIWTTKPQTATRLRARIENVLDWAKVHGYRKGENPARWRGHLDKLLPKPSKLAKIKHHPALPYDELSGFIRELRQRSGLAPLSLEFLILTATRTSETLMARWSEIDLKGRVWTIPAERMKAKREYRVPLSGRAVEILEFLSVDGKYVFPSSRTSRPLADNTYRKLLEKMQREGLTVHGFRSTFRDWAAEQTNYPREVAEMALAHTIGDKVEAAYRRGDLFEKRRRLMEDWAKFCAMPPAGEKVTPIRRIKE